MGAKHLAILANVDFHRTIPISRLSGCVLRDRRCQIRTNQCVCPGDRLGGLPVPGTVVAYVELEGKAPGAVVADKGVARNVGQRAPCSPQCRHLPAGTAELQQSAVLHLVGAPTSEGLWHIEPGTDVGSRFYLLNNVAVQFLSARWRTSGTGERATVLDSDTTITPSTTVMSGTTAT